MVELSGALPSTRVGAKRTQSGMGSLTGKGGAAGEKNRRRPVQVEKHRETADYKGWYKAYKQVLQMDAALKLKFQGNDDERKRLAQALQKTDQTKRMILQAAPKEAVEQIEGQSPSNEPLELKY